MNYDKYSKESITSYGKKLENYSLLDLFGNSIVEHVSNSKDGDKGELGVLIEKFHFNYQPNNDPGPDFSEAELELKTSKLKSFKKKGDGFRPNQRLKLKSINYNEIFDKKFESTLLYKKILDILLVYYDDDDKSKEAYEKKIKIVGHWNLPKEDIEIIRNDYKAIIDKIDDGLAHELSDGDTYILAASTSGNSKLKNQKNSSIKAKERSFTFKNHYNRFILKQILLREYSEKQRSEFKQLLEKKGIYELDSEDSYSTIDSLVLKLKQYVGKSALDILKTRNEFFDPNKKRGKSFYASATKSILGDEEENIDIIQKTGVAIKTIRVEENNSIAQNISFPAFEFNEIYNQKWEDSELFERVNSRFIFVFYKKRNDGEYYLEKVSEWLMPHADREECKKVFLETKKIISSGSIFKGYAVNKKTGKKRLSNKGNPIRDNNLPKPRHPICHVRPHATDRNDTFPLPVEDKILKVKEYTKQGFWIKNQYILDNVYKK
jgi:DNA mismatch repair protein MutH